MTCGTHIHAQPVEERYVAEVDAENLRSVFPHEEVLRVEHQARVALEAEQQLPVVR